MNRRIVLARLAVASLAIAPAAFGFDWQSLVPPAGAPPSSDDSATGSAAARGIGEDRSVASRGRDEGAVGAMEHAEPDDAHVRKFAEKGGLATGTAPQPEPVSRGAGGNSSASLGNLVQA